MNAKFPGTPNEGGPEARASFLRMEKYLLGEASPDQLLELENEAARNPGLARYLEKMQGTVSPLDWQSVRGRLGGPVNSQPSVWTRLRNWAGALFAKPSRTLAWGVAMAALLIMLPVSLTRFAPTAGLRFKGNIRPEVTLEVGGEPVAAGHSRHVKSGDILTFSYRSVRPLFAQIWYAEDGGAPSLFDGKGDANLSWPAASSWRRAQQRIQLSGDWKTQRIMVLISPEQITEQAARGVLASAQPGPKGARVFVYELVQP